VSKRPIRETLGAILESWGIRLSPASKHGGTAGLELYLPIDGQHVLVGRLSQEDGEFVFRYSESFRRRTDIPPITAFPDKSVTYRSADLWPFFQVRLPPASRADVRKLVEEKRLDPSDPLVLLGELGRKAVSAPYEFRLVPKAAS
jgi:HipA-like protein